MPRTNPTELTILTCLRCKYDWVSRKLDKNSLPVRCPRCKTDRWNKPIWNAEHSKLMLKWHALRRGRAAGDDSDNKPTKKAKKSPL